MISELNSSLTLAKSFYIGRLLRKALNNFKKHGVMVNMRVKISFAFYKYKYLATGIRLLEWGTTKKAIQRKRLEIAKAHYEDFILITSLNKLYERRRKQGTTSKVKFQV